MTFGDRLRFLRQEKGLTQNQLGEILNLSGRAVGFYESNDRFPKDEEILKSLANYFEVSIDWLLGRVDDIAACMPCDRTFTDLLKYNTVINNLKSKLNACNIISDNEDVSPDMLDLIIEHGINSGIEILKLRKKG